MNVRCACGAREVPDDDEHVEIDAARDGKYMAHSRICCTDLYALPIHDANGPTGKTWGDLAKAHA